MQKGKQQMLDVPSILRTQKHMAQASTILAEACTPPNGPMTRSVSGSSLVALFPRISQLAHQTHHLPGVHQPRNLKVAVIFPSSSRIINWSSISRSAVIGLEMYGAPQRAAHWPTLAMTMSRTTRLHSLMLTGLSTRCAPTNIAQTLHLRPRAQLCQALRRRSPPICP